VPCFTKRQLQRLCAGLCIAFAAGGTGCKSWSTTDLPGVTPYRMEIQQGNFVSQDMLSKLKRGMTREQVRFVLGTPLVADMFHADRWDYVFYREIPRKPREERRVSVFFENDRLARVEGDVVPEGEAAKPRAANSSAAPDAAAPAAQEGR
jgi:outer membrane protein assembly factor BamE